MLLLIGLVFRLVLIVLAVFVLVVLFRAILWLLKGVAMVCAALLAAGALGLVVSDAGGTDEIAVISGIAAFPVTLWVLIAWSGRRRRLRGVLGRQRYAPATEAEVAPCIYEGPSEPKGDALVTEAWHALATMVPADCLPRLYVAREQCARLLGKADGGTLDMEMLECAVLLRRNLPELAERVGTLWQDADMVERDELSAAILDDATVLGERAGALVERQRRGLKDNLEIVDFEHCLFDAPLHFLI